MGLVGLFFGAFIAGMYTDRFGRKNAISVWSGVLVVCLVLHAFMPDKYSFMTMRTLGSGAIVSVSPTHGNLRNFRYLAYCLYIGCFVYD